MKKLSATVSAEVRQFSYCKPPRHLRLQHAVALQIQFLPIQIASVLSLPHFPSISAIVNISSVAVMSL